MRSSFTHAPESSTACPVPDRRVGTDPIEEALARAPAEITGRPDELSAEELRGAGSSWQLNQTNA